MMPQRFGRYWLHETIGHGGMAEIYRATIGPDPETFAFEVALKRLLPHLQADKAMVDMFLTEADVTKLLRHPNIVQVYESGITDGRAYIAMEYVWGIDLASLLELLRKRRLRLPSELTVYVGLQVLRALDYVHRATTPAGEAMELVHRDVTPSNLYVTFDGQVKLGDFGVARVSFLEERDDAVLKGKATYMPPEVLGGATVDQRVDLWSLSVTLWELVTTRRLYEGVAEADIRSGAVPLEVEPAHVLNPDVPEALSHLLQKALGPRPRRRPKDALSLYRDLKRYLLDSGAQVDAAALGRFVAAIVGSRPRLAEAHPRAPGTGVFERPAYEVPVGMSPTQRFELVRRRRRVVGPIVAAGLAGALAAGAAGSWYAGRGSPESIVALDTRVEPPPASPATGTPPTAGPTADSAPSATESARVRPAGEPFFDFAEEVTADGESPAKAPRFSALMQRARTQAQRQRFATAEATFAEALALRPRSVPALLGRANALLELERNEEAEELVRSALALDGRDPRAQLLLGDVLWVQRRDDAAREAYRRCIELDARGRAGQAARRVLGHLDRAP